MITNPLLNNPNLPSADPTAYTNNVIQAVFSIFLIVGVIYFIWNVVMAGYHLISTEGDPKKLTQAKDQLTYAVLGLFIVFIVFALLKFIGTVTGITDLNNLQITWPTL
jgi:hypothetical protein